MLLSNDTQKERLKEIIGIADKLDWIIPINPKAETRETARCPSYPLMQLSEVEKCMLAMTNDNDLERLRDWVKECKRMTEELT